jgi:hypothetical protein
MVQRPLDYSGGFAAMENEAVPADGIVSIRLSTPR